MSTDEMSEMIVEKFPEYNQEVVSKDIDNMDPRVKAMIQEYLETDTIPDEIKEYMEKYPDTNVFDAAFFLDSTLKGQEING